MSQQIRVRIYRGQKLIGEVDRPLREFAGVPAVKYHRKSWPLLPGNRIDIDRPPLDGTGRSRADRAQAPLSGANGRDGLEASEEGRMGSSRGESIIDFARKIELELN